MASLGVKTLNIDNWLEPDEPSKRFVSVAPDGSIQAMTCNEWVQLFLNPKLAVTIPLEIQQLFEVARGAMIYGYLFYPLYTLALEQVFRVAETAVSYKCTEIGAPKSIKTFQEQIDWLITKSAIPASEGQQWHEIRKFRNFSSHPTMQMILPPGNIVVMLDDIAQRINSLFGS